ncbi:hypothetical protein ACO0QE_001471 [Hanseniaspora vineae]
MKFFDELDIEKVNQQLNFETSDCKVSGGCDLFTTKAAGSDRKLYKTIDKHLDTLVQENEAFKKFLEQHHAELSNSENGGQPQTHASEGSPKFTYTEFENDNSMKSSYRVKKSSRSNSSASLSSFWEQKRRMSASESYHTHSSHNNNYNHKNGGNNNNFNQIANPSGENVVNDGSVTENEKKHAATGENFGNSSEFLRPSSNKLNEQNLEKLIDESYGGTHPLKKKRSGSSASSINKIDYISESSPSGLNLNMGPFGPLNENHSRKIFSYLIGIMNASYPDHDFSSLAPTDFSGCSLKTLISKFENSLISLGKQPQEWIWDTINSHMDLSDCTIYQYNPIKTFMDDEIPGHLWSLMWFLFNKKRKRVAYLYLSVARLNQSSSNLLDHSGHSRRLTIEHHNMNSFEGEYDLTYDENAIDDDDENAMEDDEEISIEEGENTPQFSEVAT